MTWLRLIYKHPLMVFMLGFVVHGLWVSSCNTARAYTDNDMLRAVNEINASLKTIAANSEKCK